MNKVDSDFNTAACYHFDHRPHDSCISLQQSIFNEGFELKPYCNYTVSLLPVLCTINHEYVTLYYIILLMVRTPEINCFSVMYSITTLSCSYHVMYRGV